MIIKLQKCSHNRATETERMTFLKTRESVVLLQRHNQYTKDFLITREARKNRCHVVEKNNCQPTILYTIKLILIQKTKQTFSRPQIQRI